MRKILVIAVFTLLTAFSASAQNTQGDIFIPISKYISSSDADGLSAWFAENLEIDIMGSVNNSTRSQAKQIIKSFFSKYTPKSFSILHKSGKAPMSYAVGNLTAGGEQFRVIIYVKASGEKNEIQQLRIEKQ